MPNTVSISSDNSIENYVKIALSFASAKLGLLLIKHPLQVVLTKKQADPSLTNTEIISAIYEKNGIRGFYRSTNTSIVKILVTESYRGILMIKVPKKIHSYFPKRWSDSHPETMVCMSSLIAVPIISLIDAAIICPFTRIATLQIAAEKSNSLMAIYKMHLAENVFRQLYRGYTPLLMQTSFSWANFFVIDDLSKLILRKYFKTVSYPELALASIVGGSLQTCVNVIPDTIRVQMQKTSNHHLNMRNTIEQFVKQNGMRALISAVPHKLLGGIIAYGYKSALRHFWTPHEN